MPHGKFKGKLYCEIMRDNPEYAVDMKEAHTCSAGWKPKCPKYVKAFLSFAQEDTKKWDNDLPNTSSSKNNPPTEARAQVC